MKKPNYPYYEVTKVNSIKELLDIAGKEAGGQIAFKYKENGAVTEVTYSEFISDVNALGSALTEFGFGSSHGRSFCVFLSGRYYRQQRPSCAAGCPKSGWTPVCFSFGHTDGKKTGRCIRLYSGCMRFAVGETVSGNPFEMSLALIQYGFPVPIIFRHVISEEDKPYIERLGMAQIIDTTGHHSGIELYPSRTMPYPATSPNE